MVVLFDDELAMELGASVYGSVTDVFVNADGHKKSISAPGVGNYITVAKAVAAARAITGDDKLRSAGLVQAHGTGTPQNRVTESHILNEVARTFGIQDWPVVAVKAYLGHSIGIWEHGYLPGIATMDAVADDVHHSNLRLQSEHSQLDPQAQAYAVINAKGFGGNNASATVLAPSVTSAMLEKRHGSKQVQRWQELNEAVCERRSQYDAAASSGETRPVYKFDHGVLGPDDIDIDTDRLRIGKEKREVDLSLVNQYPDMI